MRRSGERGRQRNGPRRGGGEKEYRQRWSHRGEERQMNCWEKKKKGERKRAGGANDGRREGSKPDRDGRKEEREQNLRACSC